MNLNWIKLLPIVVGSIAIGAGSTSATINTINTHQTQKTNDPFATWAAAAKKDAVAKNIAQFVKITKISDWKSTDAIYITSVSINIQNNEVDIVLKQKGMDLSATISDLWIGQAYNINQWWCTVPPKETVATWWFNNWYYSWTDFRHEDARDQVYIISNYWYNHNITTGPNATTVNSDLHSAFWNANILNEHLQGHTISFTLMVYPALGLYLKMDATITYNKNQPIFNTSTIKPVESDWTIIKY